ncbi:MAG TPA: glycosyltransferase family 2 protein [Mycobacteriales bacterium]|nr:glycosyltransferase family 2 protein [Mycobacteriales bacterium]
MVAHDGAAWLPDVLAAIRASTVAPAQIRCVDTGSTDGSVELMRAAFGEVLELPRDTGYGAAVQAALDGTPARAWVWLLHDDCAPSPDALEELLGHAAGSPSAAVLGPKVRDWDDPRILVEVGLTIDAAGHRETGLEHGEYDQGQHDSPRDVLAVGTAGALIRRATWDAVGGLDPALPVFRDDVDLGWSVNATGERVVVVPRAVVRHARAATTGRRQTDAVRGRAAGVDRRNALFVLLAHATRSRLVGLLPWLAIATLLRASGFLLTRRPREARDEVLALVGVLRHPHQLISARRRRTALRTVPDRSARRLLASRRARMRARTTAAGAWLSGGDHPAAGLAVTGDPVGEHADDLDELAAAPPAAWRRLLARPGTVLALSLAVVAALAQRDLLPFTGGALAGGRLLAVPAGAGALWDSYAASWQPAAVGSAVAAAPSVAVLALLGTALLGKAWLAVDLLLLGSVPLAGVSAYLSTRRLLTRPLRLWAGAAWALLPIGTGAVAAGRIDAAAVQILLPVLLLLGARLLAAPSGASSWRPAWGLGLLLTLAVALAPTLWPLAVVLLLGGGVLRRHAFGRAAVAALVPLVVLAPWWWDVWREPGLLLHGPGRVAADAALVEPLLATWQLPLLHPGGAGLPPSWLTAGIVLTALGGLLRRARRPAALAGWGIALVGLAGAGLLSRAHLLASDGTAATPAWPGVPLQVAAAGMGLAALAAVGGLRGRLASSAFGWRQLVVGVVAAAAALYPVGAAALWVTQGVQGPLQRGAEPLLPAFVRAELRVEPGLRALLLRTDAAGGVSYGLTSGRGSRLGDGEPAPAAAQRAALDGVVADLLSPRGSDAAPALATRAVRYVALPAASARLAAALDAQPGLTRRSGGDVLLWQVVAPAHRTVVLPAAAAGSALSGDRGPSDELLRLAPPHPVTRSVPPGAEGRLLVLAEAADPGWRATLNGTALPRRTAWGWAQGFVLPTSGGELSIEHHSAWRSAALAWHGAALLVLVVLCAPAARRRRGLELA